MAFRSGILLLFIAAYLGSAALNALAQTSSDTSHALMAFEVASIKPAQPDLSYRSDNDLVSEGAWIGDGLRANANFQTYMLFAYNITDSVRARAIWDNLPSWARMDKYEIQATAFPGVTREQVREMLRALLIERFALQTHKETKERDTLTITLQHPGRTGPQLRSHPADQACLSDANRAVKIPAPKRGTSAPRYCGVTVWKIDDQRHLQIVDATMVQIAEALASESLQGGFPTPHAGIEVSGLTGKYDLDLEYVPQDGADETGGMDFKGALKKQAGLTLVERKQPVQIIVIDHIEKPSPN